MQKNCFGELVVVSWTALRASWRSICHTSYFLLFLIKSINQSFISLLHSKSHTQKFSFGSQKQQSSNREVAKGLVKLLVKQPPEKVIVEVTQLHQRQQTKNRKMRQQYHSDRSSSTLCQIRLLTTENKQTRKLRWKHHYNLVNKF